MTILPRALRRGDRVAVISPASPVRDRSRLDRGLRQLKDWGLKPTLMPHCLRQDGYLAGSDAQRADDLQTAIDDPETRAILCSRGGYGAMRILDRIDFTRLREDPKPLLGYSDITVLLAAAFAAVGLGGLHGPMVATADSHAMGEACTALQHQLLTDPENPAELPAIDRSPGPLAIVDGNAEGRLVGGNLALVVALIGTPWAIDTTDRILFLEDIDEPAYRVDRMLTQLRLCGSFDRAAGIVLGDFHVSGTPLGSQDEAILAVFRDRLGGLAIPVTYGWPFGHRPESWTLPFGSRARLEADDHGQPPQLRLLEPAVAR